VLFASRTDFRPKGLLAFAIVASVVGRPASG
jgi:hypothetical protein